MNSKSPFLHERLLAYTVSLDYYRVVRRIVKQMPRGNAELADQITRAGRTNYLAIAEGANSRGPKMKYVYFDRALASQGESASCLDGLLIDEAAPAELVAQARTLLERATRLTLGLIQ